MFFFLNCLQFFFSVHNSRSLQGRLSHLRLSPAGDDVGGLEDEEEEEDEVLIGKEVFPRRDEGARTRERFSGITARGGGATRPW